MSDSKEELQKGDAVQTEWPHNREEALCTCINEADQIILEVEHCIDEIDLLVELRDVFRVAEAIRKVSNLRYKRRKVLCLHLICLYNNIGFDTYLYKRIEILGRN